MTEPNHDDAWLQAQVPRVDDALVRRTIAGARARAARPKPVLWPVGALLLAAGAAALIFSVKPAPKDPPLAAYVVVEDPPAEDLPEALEDDLDLWIPGTMDPTLEDLTAEELAAISDELTDWSG